MFSKQKKSWEKSHFFSRMCSLFAFYLLFYVVRKAVSSVSFAYFLQILVVYGAPRRVRLNQAFKILNSSNIKLANTIKNKMNINESENLLLLWLHICRFHKWPSRRFRWNWSRWASFRVSRSIAGTSDRLCWLASSQPRRKSPEPFRIVCFKSF